MPPKAKEAASPGDAELTLTACTIANNTATWGGGGISLSDDTLRVVNCTIAGNSGDLGGGICYSFYGTSTGQSFLLSNTIVANNTATVDAADIYMSSSEVTLTASYCLIEDISGITFNGYSINDITGVDPMLGELADNGGPTQTMALLEDSRAINGGNNTFATQGTDQRGYYRTDACGRYRRL